jgi:hypothetical protein
MEELKECRRCFKMKPRSEFHKSSRCEDGLQTWCKQCISEYKVWWRDGKRSPRDQAELDRVRENQELVGDGLKRCGSCGEVKPLDEFWSGEGTGERRGICAVCGQARNYENGYGSGDWRNVPLEQRRAIKALGDAARKGDIVRPASCSICGRSPKKRAVTRIQFHHTNGYDPEHWYFGVFVCTWCHNAIHRGKVKVEGRDYNPYA